MPKANSQIDIAVLKEQIIQLGRGQTEMQADIAVIKDKLDDTFVRKVNYEMDAKANQDTHVDIDTRLRVLENWRWWLVGAMAALAFYFEFIHK